MNKKIKLLLFFIIFNYSLFAWEINLSTGYDFFRNHHSIFNLTDSQNDEKGFKLSLDYLPYNKGLVDLGIGLEYNFYNFSKKNDAIFNKYLIPIYFLTKTNLYKTYDNDITVSLINRIGFATYKRQNNKLKSSFYSALGIQIEYAVFNFTVLYDLAIIPKEIKNERIQNKISVNLGIRFGDYKIKKPKVETILEKNI